MARGDQLGRQWIILQNLINSQSGKSISDLSKKINCHTRTIYRDLDALQIAGFPVYSDKRDGKTYWHILEIEQENNSIPCTLSELMALYFGRNMLTALNNTIFQDSLKSLINKIGTTLPKKYIVFLDQFENNIKIGQKPLKLYSDFRQTLNQFNKAIENSFFVNISYFTMSRNEKNRRKVAPYNVWFFDNTFYLIGLCMLRKEIRTFAFDRISSIEILEEKFLRPADFSIDRYMESSFGTFHGETTKVKIWFAPEVTGYIKEKVWHKSQVITDQEDGSIIFQADVAGTDEIKIWVMGWGSNAVVIEPNSLKIEILSEINLLTKLYAKNMSKKKY